MGSNRRTLVAIYVVMAVAVTVVAVVVFSAGQDRHAEKSIAGGYDLAKPDTCLGASFDIRQSGEFANIENADGSLGGSLRVDNGRLTGDVSCVGDASEPIDAHGGDRALKGTIGGRPLQAALTRDPPPPGPRPRAPDSIAGDYVLKPRSACLGAKMSIEGSGPEYELVRSGTALGHVTYEKGAITGEGNCADGSKAPIAGKAADRTLTLTVGEAQVTAEKQREAGNRFAAFFIAVTVVMLLARLFGNLAVRIKQPRVMGEVLAGIVLGPTIVGAFLPDVETALFPSDIIPFIGVVAQLGLIFYMFLVGLEVDLEPDPRAGRPGGRHLQRERGAADDARHRGRAAGLRAGRAGQEVRRVRALHGRLHVDHRLPGARAHPGRAADAQAAGRRARARLRGRRRRDGLVPDRARVRGRGSRGSGAEVVETIALAVVFVAVMGFAIRPLLARASTAFDEAGRVPGGWIAAIFAGVLLSAYVTEQIGIALIFGAFVMGLVMPRHAGLTEDVTHRIEDFVMTLLLPLFFAYTGLQDQRRPARPPRAVAAHARADRRRDGRQAVRGDDRGPADRLRLAAVGGDRDADEHARPDRADRPEPRARARRDLRGAVRDARDDGDRHDVHGRSGAQAARPATTSSARRSRRSSRRRASSRVEPSSPALTVPDESILVAPQSDGAFPQLLSLAKPLARSEPPRELILAKLVRPPRGAAARGGLQTENRLLQEATEEMAAARRGLVGRGHRGALSSVRVGRPGRRPARLAAGEKSRWC